MAQKSSIYDYFIIWPLYVTLTFHLPKHVSNGTTSPQGEHMCKIILKSMHKCRSYGPHKLNIWPFYHLTFECDNLQLTQILQENTCATLFWNPCINVEVMAQTSSIYDHFIIWPSCVTLTFNWPKQMFQMALLFLKENICAKLFWNPWINVEVMAQTSSIYDHFIMWPSSVTLTLNPPNKCFKWHYYSSMRIPVHHYFEIHA